MILSGNAIDHALLTLGGFLAGVPVVPVSPAYSLMSQDYGKVKHIAALVKPGLVYAADAGAVRRRAAARSTSAAPRSCSPSGAGATAFAELADTPADARGRRRAAPRSARTAWPRSCSRPARRRCPRACSTRTGCCVANQQSLAQIWPFTEDTPPVLVDWLPWNHTFGGNHNFNLILKRGGTLYIDAGRPAPPLIADHGAQPDRDRADDLLQRARGLRRAAAVPGARRGAARALLRAPGPDLLRRRRAAAGPVDAAGGRRARGARRAGDDDLLLGADRDLAAGHRGALPDRPRGRDRRAGAGRARSSSTPVEDKLEMRVKGPNVTPGYLGQPDARRAKAFDEDGWYRTGDAGRLEDPDDPNKGLVFDGRVVEDFKLLTGTFVSVGNLRIAALAAASPLLMDAVVCGHDRDYVGAAGLAERRRGAGDRGRAGRRRPRSSCARPKLAEFLRERFVAYNRSNPASSTRVERVILLAEPPSLDANEITDKGYVNQRAALERRARARRRAVRRATRARR